MDENRVPENIMEATDAVGDKPQKSKAMMLVLLGLAKKKQHCVLIFGPKQ